MSQTVGMPLSIAGTVLPCSCFCSLVFGIALEVADSLANTCFFRFFLLLPFGVFRGLVSAKRSRASDVHFTDSQSDFAMLIAILSRANSTDLAKHLAEVALVIKTNGFANLRNRDFLLPHQFLCFGDA